MLPDMACLVRFLLVVVCLSTAAFAQAPAPVPERVVVKDVVGNAATAFDDAQIDDCPTGVCCPPSTSKKVIMVAACIAVYLILFFLLVRLLERAFIKQEKSPMLGRHAGISAALFLGTAASAGIIFLVSGCWGIVYSYLAGVMGVVWLFHFIYTMIAIRK
jgi:hypothetical protein